eukprot:6479463-Amphidinium_carterae.1
MSSTDFKAMCIILKSNSNKCLAPKAPNASGRAWSLAVTSLQSLNRCQIIESSTNVPLWVGSDNFIIE